MAGDWIKMRGNLWDDPRIARMCDLTEASEASVIGGLYWLWATADQHSETGLMSGLTLRQIDRKTGVPGLGAALVEVNWLVISDDGAQLVRFEEHNGTSAKRRCSESRRKMSARDADKEQTACGFNADETQQSCAPREEKRREEEYTQSSTVVETQDVPTVAECPHSEILKLWAEVLPSARQPADWNSQRQTLLRSRWREKPNRQNLEWWGRLFRYMEQSDFLMGRTESKGRAPFLLSLDWLLKSANFLKVIEGAYHTEVANA